MTDQPIVLVGTNRTRAVGRLDVATGPDRPDEPGVRFDPMAPSVTVGGGEPLNAGEIRLTNDGSVARGVLAATDGNGSLELRDADGRPDLRVTADDDAPEHTVSLFSGDREATRLENTPDEVRFAVFDLVGGQPIVEAAVDAPSRSLDQAGRLAVADRTGFPSCRLLGRDGALVLTGGEENTTRTAELNRYGPDAFGGGELVVRTNDAVDESVIDASDVDDVHVHATAERDSDYGVDADNRPRIHLDGPEARIELGRAGIDDDRPGVNGEIRVRGDRGTVLLSAGVENRLTGENGGSLEFRRSTDDGGTHVGSISAHEDGLVIRFSRDAVGHDFPTAMLVTKRGEIKLQNTLQTDGV